MLPLGGVDIKARQAPDPAEQGPIIAAALGLAIGQLFSRHAGQQHPAPATQLLSWQASRQGTRGQLFGAVPAERGLAGGGRLKRHATGACGPGQEGHHKLGGKFRTAIAVEPGPQAGEAPDQHPAHRQPFRLRQQAVARLMQGNAAQASLAARQCFGQHVAAAAAKTGRIQAEGPKG